MQPLCVGIATTVRLIGHEGSALQLVGVHIDPLLVATLPTQVMQQLRWCAKDFLPFLAFSGGDWNFAEHPQPLYAFRLMTDDPTSTTYPRLDR